MTKLWTIRPLCLGEFPVLDKSAFTYGTDYGVKISAPAVAWLLQSDNEAIMVDTGQEDPETAHPCHSRTIRKPEHRPEAALKAAGVSPDQIKTVIFTHLHWDHACNIHLFPEARFIVQAEELKSAVDPILPQRRDYEYGFPGVRPKWFEAWDRLQVVRGEVSPLPGITLVLKPGHTPGLQCVVVETAAGPHLITSDLAPLYENIGIDAPAPVLPGIHTDLAACERSLEWVRAFPGVKLPSHDWGVFEQPVYPAAK